MATVSIIGSLSALFIAILVLFYNAGGLAARLHTVEEWMIRNRADMHEVSDKIECVSAGIKILTTLVEERTERRQYIRSEN